MVVIILSAWSIHTSGDDFDEYSQTESERFTTRSIGITKQGDSSKPYPRQAQAMIDSPPAMHSHISYMSIPNSHHLALDMVQVLVMDL